MGETRWTGGKKNKRGGDRVLSVYPPLPIVVFGRRSGCERAHSEDTVTPARPKWPLDRVSTKKGFLKNAAATVHPNSPRFNQRGGRGKKRRD